VDEPVTAVADLARQATHLSPVLGRYFERSWSHGEGHRLFDTSGRAYLDFANGIAVTALGHRHPRVAAAVHAQVDRLMGPTGAIGYSQPVVHLARMLAQTFPSPIDTIMFLNSGSEAIDGSLKLARRVTGRPGIVAFRGGFHGRTFGATSITSSNLNYRTGYEPLLPGVYLTPYPAAYPDYAGDPDAATAHAVEHLETLLHTVIAPSQIAAMVIEPVLGEGGYQPAPASFLRWLRKLCDEHGILLVADEVQTGYGRTGRMWAFESAGVVPDVVAVAKAIANGLPLSAIEAEDLVGNAARRGEELTAGLARLKAEDDRIGDVRGPGLMVGVEFVRDRSTGEPDGDLATAVVARSAELGLLVLTCGIEHQVVRWIAPLDVTAAEISEGIEIFAEAVRTV
jgi:4-aminobutyrate aminotransferase